MIVALILFGCYLAFVGLWSLVESSILIVRGLPRAWRRFRTRNRPRHACG